MWLKMSSSDNRKHKTLNLSATAEIITKFDKPEKLVNLAEDSGVGHATIFFSSSPSFSVIRRYLGPISVGLPRLYCMLLVHITLQP
jgi:hypothetical protein